MPGTGVPCDANGVSEAGFAEARAGNTDIRLYVDLTVRSECDTPLGLVLQQALMLYIAKCYIASSKEVNIRDLGISSKRRSVDMSKQNSPFANGTTRETAPKTSDTPMITSTGSVYWNVRDIVFKPATPTKDTSTILSNSSAKE